MAAIKTQPTDADVTEFLDAVPHAGRRAEGHRMREMFERVTGRPATMWGPTIVGFGTMSYTATTGTNDWFVVGFSPRKAALTIYGVVPYGGELPALLAELGPHTTGKSCLYITRLERVDEAVLERLVTDAWRVAAA